MEPRRVILIHLRDTNGESANVNMYYVYMVQKNRKNTKRQRESWRCESVSDRDSWPNRRTRIQIPGNREPLTLEMVTGSERETK